LYRTVLTLYRHELLCIVRDRRTVFLVLLLPLFLTPFVVYISTRAHAAQSEASKQHVFRYAVDPAAADLLHQVEQQATLRMQAVPSNDPRRDLQRGRLDFYVRQVPGSVPRVALFYRGNDPLAPVVSEEIKGGLEAVRQKRRMALLPALPTPVPVVEVNVATAEETAGSHVGPLLTVIVVLLTLSGAASAAGDVVSGERERGTLETLFTTAVRREDIVVAKLMAVVTISLAAAVANVGGIGLGLGLHLVSLPAEVAASLSTLRCVELLFWYLPVVLLAAGLQLLVSARAPSFKAAQFYFQPILLGGLVLSLAGLLPALTLRSAIVLLPIAGLSVGARELMSGHADTVSLGLAWLVNLGAGVLAVQACLHIMMAEDFLLPVSDEPAALLAPQVRLRRHMVRWLAFFWVLIFLAGQSTDIKASVLFNMAVCLGGSLYIVHRYRLDRGAVLALRPVHAGVFLAVLVGAPAGAVVASDVFDLVSHVLPIPPGYLEAFAKMGGNDVPWWQLLIGIAVLPGVCEEVLFRGLAVYAWQTRLRPAWLCVAVGAAFAFFHFDIYRMAPVFLLGVILTGVRIMSGSLFPGMLWHMVNNSLALSATAFDHPPAWAHVAAPLVLGAALLVIRGLGSRQKISQGVR
jgi:sodium transport system permease protein